MVIWYIGGWGGCSIGIIQLGRPCPRLDLPFHHSLILSFLITYLNIDVNNVSQKAIQSYYLCVYVNALKRQAVIRLMHMHQAVDVFRGGLKLAPLVCPPNTRSQFPIVFLQVWVEDVKIDLF